MVSINRKESRKIKAAETQPRVIKAKRKSIRKGIRRMKEFKAKTSKSKYC
jgi:hypothetical protein